MASFTQYTDLATVKAYGSIDTADTNDDAVISNAITAVQNAIDTFCNWSFQDETRTNEERSLPDVKVDNDGYLQIRVDKCPVYAVASVAYRLSPASAWVSVDASLIEFYPTPGSVPYPRANSNLIMVATSLGNARSARLLRVKVTYSGGFATTTPPGALQWLATRMAWWKYKQRAAAFDKIAMPSVGTVIVPSALPADIRSDLNQWKRVA